MSASADRKILGVLYDHLLPPVSFDCSLHRSCKRAAAQRRCSLTHVVQQIIHLCTFISMKDESAGRRGVQIVGCKM